MPTNGNCHDVHAVIEGINLNKNAEIEIRDGAQARLVQVFLRIGGPAPPAPGPFK